MKRVFVFFTSVDRIENDLKVNYKFRGVSPIRAEESPFVILVPDSTQLNYMVEGDNGWQILQEHGKSADEIYVVFHDSKKNQDSNLTALQKMYGSKLKGWKTDSHIADSVYVRCLKPILEAHLRNDDLSIYELPLLRELPNPILESVTRLHVSLSRMVVMDDKTWKSNTWLRNERFKEAMELYKEESDSVLSALAPEEVLKWTSDKIVSISTEGR